MQPSVKKLLVCALLLALAACQSKVKTSPHVKIGKPYVISGQTYYPAYDDTYDEIGYGSWYGPGFHGKKTASGERFDQNDITAAHPTLPMPSLVRVTNLANGQSIIVRINDRGPFKKGRIIDLSKKSAERIGMHSTMKVRVQYLSKETEEYLASLEGDDKSIFDMKTYNDKVDTAKSAPLQTISSADLESPTASPSPAPVLLKADEEVVITEHAAEGEIETLEVLKPAGSLRNMPVKSTAKTADKHTNTLATKAESKPAAKPAPVAAPAPAATAEKFNIQAGTFSNKENAAKLVKKLSSVPGVATEKIERNGKPFWRVRAGPFNDKKSAERALEKIRANGAPDAAISR